ncbi:MAG: SIS domain-containing protein [Deltaproteobacteria bacterium]|nr:SIS domain-containing protein [Deltaproteobacteria bacterium]MBW2360792.1 SIS domain-containing protein [Deltaproteobacteria bacterium]
MSVLDVVGIGSMVLDRVHRAPRLLGAEAKGILRDVAGAGPVQSHVGGVVLNHLGWAAALGLRTGIFGRQGDDADGRLLRAAMQAIGMERDLTLVDAATSVAEIFVDDGGGRAIYMAPGATSGTTAAYVRDAHADTIRSAARLTTEVSQLPLAAALAALEIARAAGVPSVVDLDVPPSEAVPGLGSQAELDAVLRSADLLKPAKAAAAELVPEAGSDALAVAAAMRARFGNAAVVVTDGAAGCAVSAEGVEAFVGGFAVEVVDTTGAGDALLGGLLVALHHGLDWESAARLGNACGAVCAGKLGAFPDDTSAARERVLELYDAAPLSLGDAPAAGVAGAAPALAAYEIAVEELGELRGRLSPLMFDAALTLLNDARVHGGRVHVTGVGKPEHVAHYAASLLSSTGTPASFLHATEAVHGSAGQVVAGDVVIAISNSGETQELLAAVAAVQRLGARLIAVTGGLASPLAAAADAVLDAGVKREGGPLGLAPRASVAAELLVVASLAAAQQAQLGFTRRDYNQRHSAGKLGALSSDES